MTSEKKFLPEDCVKLARFLTCGVSVFLSVCLHLIHYLNIWNTDYSYGNRNVCTFA